MQRNRYAGTLRAQHDGEELVRQRQLVAAEAIGGHQQPSRQALLDLVQSIAECGLRGLHQKRMRIRQDGAMQGSALLVGFAQLA